MIAGARSRLQDSAHAHPVGLIWAGVVVYSTGPVLVASSSVDGASFSMMRLLVGVPVLLAAVSLAGPGTLRAGKSAVVWTVLAGLSFAVHQLLFMSAIKLASVTDVVLMNTLAPVAVMVLAAPMFGERTDGRFRWWTAVAIAGAAFVAVSGSIGPRGDPLGMGLAALNVVAFSLFFLCSKAARPHIDVWPFLLAVVVIATVTVGLYFLLTGRTLISATGDDWLLALVLAVGPGALGHFLMTWPLAWVRANVPPVLRLLQPFLAGGLAWIVLGQPVTVAHVVGGAVTATGVLGAMGVLSIGASRSLPPVT